jgi:hypothetical protein
MPIDPKRTVQELNTATSRFLASGRDPLILWGEMHPLLERLAFSISRNMLEKRGTFRTKEEIRGIAEGIADYVARRYLEDDTFSIKLYGPYIRLRFLDGLGSSVGSLSFSDIGEDFDGEGATHYSSRVLPPSSGADPYLTPRSRREISKEKNRRREALARATGQDPDAISLHPLPFPPCSQWIQCELFAEVS